MKRTSSGPGAASTPLALMDPRPTADEAALRIAHLPKETGWALIAAGIVGLLVPGVIGTPFLLAGAAVLAPGGSNLLSRWAPRSTTRQIARFSDDLERRYPHR